LSLGSYVTLDTGLHNPEPQFPHLQNGDSPLPLPWQHYRKEIYEKDAGENDHLAPGSPVLALEGRIAVHQAERRERAF
jgi:hypothetical protein